MAFVRFADGSEKTLKHETALQLWLVLNGKTEGTTEQQAFCERVRAVFLNWRKAPDDYLYQHKEQVIPLVRSRWLHDRNGRPLRPDPSDKDCVRVSHVLDMVYRDPMIHN